MRAIIDEIDEIGAAYGCTPEELGEMHAAAARDPDGAERCYRALAAELSDKPRKPSGYRAIAEKLREMGYLKGKPCNTC